MAATLAGSCPRCGAKTLFNGWINFADKCRGCGLDFAAFNVGDGPAAFLILIVGAVVAVLAVWVQLAFEPAYWVHVVLWVPIATAMTIGGLRVAKAALLSAAFRNRAGEGRPK